jgi:hypothetical protein
MGKHRRRKALPQAPRKGWLRSWHAPLLALAVAGAATLAYSTHHSKLAQTYRWRPKGSVTFSKNIAPIIYEHCSECHRPGQSAPCNLISWQEVRRHAQQIAEVTEKRIMPPWLPEAGHEPLLESRVLSSEQLGLLRQWARRVLPREIPRICRRFPKGPRIGNWELPIWS